MKKSKDFNIIPNITPLKPLWNKTLWKKTKNIDDKSKYPFSEEFDDIFFKMTSQKKLTMFLLKVIILKKDGAQKNTMNLRSESLALDQD